MRGTCILVAVSLLSNAVAACLLASTLLSPALHAQAAPAAPAAPAQAATPAQAAALINGYQPTWWKQAVVYQVYPRSFKDSNGDGIGDLNGITEKLDYLQNLGVSVIWLSPHYDSPNVDNGYDIRDYRKVMADFGTMADFDRLLAAVKQRHMRMIIDLVVNHTSDEHRWFVESRKSLTNPYRDFYIWRPGKPDPSAPAANGAPAGLAPPNNYPSYFSGSAWQYDEPTKQFYLHLFAVKQPDLNWDNPKVRADVYSLMRFWLDKGVDGFRMDVIPLISKPAGMPDLTAEQLKNPPNAYANGPHLAEYLQEMNKDVLSKYDIMTVGEATGTTLAQTDALVDDRRHELDMIFNFDAIKLGRADFGPSTPGVWSLPNLKAIYDAHADVLTKHEWDTVFLSNHDNPRIVSTFGDVATPELRVRSAKLLEAMLLTLRGTPFLYQGDELGMTNYPFTRMDQFNDIAVKNAYKANVLTGKISEADFLADQRQTSRDNARTPMQWADTSNGGFTTAATPWLAVNPNYTTINAANELADPNSVYHFTAQAVALHRDNPALVYGDYTDLDPDNAQIYAYTRTLGATRFLIVLNFSTIPTEYVLPGGMSPGTLVLGNLPAPPSESTTLHLRPWEARIYRY